MNIFSRTSPVYIEKPIRDAGLPLGLAGAAVADLHEAVRPVRVALSDYDDEIAAVNAMALALDPPLTPSGQQKRRQEIAAKRADAGATLLPTLEAKRSADEERRKNLVFAADGGMTWDAKLHSYVKTQSNRTPEELADEREARDVWRQRPKNELREIYRAFVLTKDPRARWMERDPLAELVTERDREWAREHRIEHSEFKDQIALLDARLRAWALLIDAASREFNAPVVGL